MHTCAICEQQFLRWQEYHLHINAGLCHKKLVPLNTSGRSREQIVQDAEQTWLKKYLITKDVQHEKTSGFEFDYANGMSKLIKRMGMR